MSSGMQNPAEDLMRFILSRWISKPIYVAAKLGIADILSDGPKTLKVLSSATDTDVKSLYRLLRALCSVEIFKENTDGSFELTAMAELLKSDAMRSMVLMFQSDWNDLAWLKFPDGMKSGDTPFELAYKTSLAEWLKNNPQAAQIFNEANATRSFDTSKKVVKEFDFSSATHVLDVGGGLGILLCEILKAYPHLTGTIADLAHVLDETKGRVAKLKLSSRCKLVECDFFSSIPEVKDTLILSNILHDWDDRSCKKILSNCRKSMGSGTKALFIEMIIPEGNTPSIAKLLDLEMFTMTGGRERTLSEFKDLFNSEGFEVNTVTSLGQDTFIIGTS